MYYTMSNLSNFEYSPANESYRTMKITWDNMNKICRDYTDKIDVESSVKRIIQLETEYLDKLNEVYNLIENDKLSLIDRFFKKFLPNVLMVIGATLTCLSLSKFETDNDDQARAIMNGVGMVGVGTSILAKVKTSTAVNFKQNALTAIEETKKELKKDIQINQKFISIGINTRAEMVQCNIEYDKNGNIEVYRKYN